MKKDNRKNNPGRPKEIDKKKVTIYMDADLADATADKRSDLINRLLRRHLKM